MFWTYMIDERRARGPYFEMTIVRCLREIMIDVGDMPFVINIDLPGIKELLEDESQVVMAMLRHT